MNKDCRTDVSTRRTSRVRVYQAIDSERIFQDSFAISDREYHETHTLGEFILMLNQYAAQAMDKWTHHKDKDGGGFPDSLHEVRKIAAIAVRCMEQHGAPERDLRGI